MIKKLKKRIKKKNKLIIIEEDNIKKQIEALKKESEINRKNKLKPNKIRLRESIEHSINYYKENAVNNTEKWYDKHLHSKIMGLELALTYMDRIYYMGEFGELVKNKVAGFYEEKTVSREVLDAINDYIDDKNIAYRVDDDQSDDTQTVIKIINADNNSTAIVRITDMDWI